MAWVKIKSVNGDILNVPETVYKNMFANNEGFSLVQDEPKPSPKIEQKQEVESDGIQKPKLDENKPYRKSSKKTSEQLS